MKVVPYESETFIQEMEDTWQGNNLLATNIWKFKKCKNLPSHKIKLGMVCVNITVSD